MCCGVHDIILDIQLCGNETKSMNEYTTDQVNKRKLQFNTDKCGRMHVGKVAHHCEDISLDNWKVEKVKSDKGTELVDKHVGKQKIKEVDSQEYLGDIVSPDGSHAKSVEARINKSHGVVRDILALLEQVYVDDFFFEALILLRSSLLLSVLTHNVEVWP